MGNVSIMMQKRDSIVFQTYIDIYERLKSLALTRFRWNNLPQFCNERFLERCLYENGKACFCRHKQFQEIMNFRVVPSDTMTVYEEHDRYRAFSVGYSEVYDKKDIVIVRNNTLEKSTDSTIELYAYRLTNLLCAIDVNIEAQKTPVVIVCDEKERMTYKNAYKQRADNEPVIYGSKSFNVDNFKVLSTNANYVSDKIRLEYINVWNECMSFLGINNSPVNKRERLVTDEVNSNNELIQSMASTYLKMRQDACTELNKKFGTNVSVEMIERGEDNGEIHDRVTNID